jgi:signal transduction histidine kinase
VVLKFKPQSDKHKIKIHSQLPDTKPLVQADIGMIERALSNLLDNALNYTPDQGDVTVELKDNNDLVTILVHDTGKGIPEQDLPHIFDRFFRVDKSRATEGTGLGLAITKKIVEVHHGEISVRSQLNKGTTFAIDLNKGAL